MIIKFIFRMYLRRQVDFIQRDTWRRQAAAKISSRLQQTDKGLRFKNEAFSCDLACLIGATA